MSVFKLRKLMYIVGGLITVALGIYGYLAYRKEQKLIEEEEELEEKQEQVALKKEAQKVKNEKGEGDSKKVEK